MGCYPGAEVTAKTKALVHSQSVKNAFKVNNRLLHVPLAELLLQRS